MEEGSIDSAAPAVVAVMVTSEPGPWFDDALRSLAGQDYENLSVLVIVSGGKDDPTERVAELLPDAFVRRLEDALGFGAAANVVLEMVEGAAFFLFCHDDCAPDPDAVHVMVEESYRSNAGIVGPKVVRWDDPSILVHVGMNVDKSGAVVERVHFGEVDHGQHDAVRDVFMVPGGCTLVRADLFAALGGFDPGILAMGEDLDLCWRAQVAGARVLVAPDARARHREVLSSGLRPVPADPERSASNPSLQELERRHELRAVLGNYSRGHLVWVLPQVILLGLGELVASALARDGDRARALLGAWRWNLSHYQDLRRRHRSLEKVRVLSDHEVRRLQLRGSARLSTYTSRLVHQDFDVAHGRAPSQAEGAVGVLPPAEPEPELTGSVGQAFSEDSDFDELDDMGRRSGRDRFGRRRRRPILGTRRSRLALWFVVALILLIGSRDLLSGSFPLVGQLLPFPSWTGAWERWFAGWQPAGLGSASPVTPAFGVLGILGILTAGGMGLLEKILVLGCIPLGAWGMSRMLRPLCSPRARLIGAICYLALPLPYDALARGRWDGLVAFGLLPWIVTNVLHASGIPPYGARWGGSAVNGSAVNGSAVNGSAVGATGVAVTGSTTAPTQVRDWAILSRPVLRGMLVVGVLDAVASAFAPAVAVALVVSALGIIAGSAAVGQWRGSFRVAGVVGGGTLVAAVLCAPWVVGALVAGKSAVAVFGLQGPPSSSLGWTALLRFAVGPVGSTPLSWLIIAASFMPLLIGRAERLAWAGRLWTTACLSWILALVVVRGWSGIFAPSLDVVLVPAAIAVAASAGLGVAAFERDLPAYRFGWRQIVTGIAAVAGVVGVIPVVAAAGGGRWNLVTTGFSQPLSYLSPRSNGTGATPGETGAQYRVLWLGDPSALPTAGWNVTSGFAFATSTGGTPGPMNLWAPASPGPAEALAGAVKMALVGRTSHLGRLLAPAAVRYVVVVGSFAPQITGVQQLPAEPLPPGLIPSLQDQTDMVELSSEANGFSVFENTEAMPERGERRRGVAVRKTRPGSQVPLPSPADIVGWHAVMSSPVSTSSSPSFSGELSPGAVFAGLAPAGRWTLQVSGTEVHESSVFGWAGQFEVTSRGRGSLSFDGYPLLFWATLAELLLWMCVALVLLNRARWLAFWVPCMRGVTMVRHRFAARMTGNDISSEQAPALVADAFGDPENPEDLEAGNGTTDEPADHSTDEPADHSTDEPADRTTDEPADRTTDEPADDTSMKAGT